MNDGLKRTPMGMLDKEERIHNFNEVELGYTKEEAIKEASRCLQCKNPMCMKGCPVGHMIPEWIKAIKEDRIDDAYKIISAVSSLPAICGRVCPQEQQCEKTCVRGIKGDSIAIGALERYVADNAKRSLEYLKKNSNGKKIAIVGSGPAGITCATDLAREGFEVTIYEALHRPGGVLAWGIPEFRLPKKITEETIKRRTDLGIKIKYNEEESKALLNELEKEITKLKVSINKLETSIGLLQTGANWNGANAYEVNKALVGHLDHDKTLLNKLEKCSLSLEEIVK